MEWVETTGRSVQEAKEKALDELGVDEADAEFEVLAEAQTGLFGRLRSEARVRARVRPTAPRPKEDRRDRRRRNGRSPGSGRPGTGTAPADDGGGGTGSGRTTSPSGTNGGEADSGRTAGVVAVGTDSPGGGSTEGSGSSGSGTAAARKRRRRGGRNRRGDASVTAGAGAGGDGGDGGDGAGGAGARAGRADTTGGRPGGAGARAGGSSSPNAGDIEDTEDTEDTEADADGDLTTKGTVVEVDLDRQAEVAVDFLTGLTREFGLQATVEVSRPDEDTVELQLSGSDLGILIGPKGATLVALQNLTRTVVFNETGGNNGHLDVDVAGYRHKRTQALTRFAAQVANSVKESGQPTALEPMTAVDRKVVHDAISGIDGVTTISEGEEPRRRIVVLPA